ncbi:hypothetical protein B7494_g3503 [Chlorociboria aeruginascens]|nr:hypothetical protein B7494_g3503 [Chlorociboria aeruginascens]
MIQSGSAIISIEPELALAVARTDLKNELVFAAVHKPYADPILPRSIRYFDLVLSPTTLLLTREAMELLRDLRTSRDLLGGLRVCQAMLECLHVELKVLIDPKNATLEITSKAKSTLENEQERPLYQFIVEFYKMVEDADVTNADIYQWNDEIGYGKQMFSPYDEYLTFISTLFPELSKFKSRTDDIYLQILLAIRIPRCWRQLDRL